MRFARYLVALALLIGATPSFASHLIVKMSCACPEKLTDYRIVRTFAMDPTMFVVEAKGVEAEAATQALMAMPEVSYVRPNRTLHLVRPVDSVEAAPEVPYSLPLTQVDRLHEQGIVGDPKLIVGVVDTGSSPDHPELTGRVLPGKNFVDGAPATDQGIDDNGHGTHVSGTIAGTSVGFAPCVQILPAKFLDAGGSGSLEGALAAIDFAASHGARILSNSWGGGDFDQSLFDIIKKVSDKGILFVAAAGNDASDNDATPSFPASYQVANVVSVAASDASDQPASFTNFGLTTVHVAAPGVDILSSFLKKQYRKLSGTSMATPAITGTVALMLSVNPKLTPPQIRDILISTADKVDALGKTTVSKGRLNAYKAVMAAKDYR